ncbi:hypothetical protein V8C86DRAFT_2507722 [Haematococcus lacustris]
MPPPPFDKSGRSSMRPASAPRPRTAGSSSPGRPAPRPLGAAPTSLLDNMVTFTGAPCYTVSALIEADLQEGCPVAGPLTPSHKGSPASQAVTPHELGSSRVARVLTYAVPPSGLGYGEGGVRPFHQDYRHYKYFGFAGRGAKTSWAHNPKYAQTYEHHPSPAAQAAWAAVPPQPDPGPELQPLTPVQVALVGQFRQHLHEREGGSPSPTANRSLATNRPGSARPAPRSPLPTEILEPYKQHVSIATAAPLSPAEARDRQRTDRALMTTYRQPAPSDLMLTENPSPHCGSQSPFHQRYKHYKYHGFAGRGASSSWARNPKLALLYDH